MNLVARTAPPAKLNLFLEIPSKRDDGFHEIDTVMVAIDLADQLEIETTPDPNIQMKCSWLPSMESIAAELDLPVEQGKPPGLLRIPTDQSNLVVKALTEFKSAFGTEGGFSVRLYKRIPAGAGMGGASSDAAHALRCAAQLHQIPESSKVLHDIASSIGSDVPFFLRSVMGNQHAVDGHLSEGRVSEGHVTAENPNDGLVAARATGRGEVLTPLHARPSLALVLAYPNKGLSTAAVYKQLRLPESPCNSSAFITAFESGERSAMASSMMNRLTQPALEILPRSGELIESLWQIGLQPCQLTGSGSACFGLAENTEHAHDAVERLKVDLQPGVMLRVVHTVSATAPIEIETI